MNPSRIFLAAALSLGAPAAPGAVQAPLPQEDPTYINEVNPRFLERLRQLEERQDWKGLFEWAADGLRLYGRRVVRTETGSWTGLSEYILRRVSRLPREAHEYYRLEYDGRARAEFDRAREQGDRRLLERAVEKYFFSSLADEGLDSLGCSCFEEGAPEEAIFHWNRLLRLYPDSNLPRAVTAARIAHAAEAAGNEALLEDLRRYVASENLDGPVVVGNRRVSLGEYLAGVRISPHAPAPREAGAPYVRGPGESLPPRSVGVRNEILRWTYDFEIQRGASLPAGAARLAADHFPVFPAYARVRGKEYVIFSDGARVVAVDPARVRASEPARGIYWMYPTGGAVARPLAAQAQALQLRFAAPYVGVAVDGEHAFVTLYSATRSRDPNSPNSDYFEGPGAVLCFHIPSGKLVWDTDSSPLAEALRELSNNRVSGFDFLGRNYAFSSPVLVRGGRVYVGVSASPMVSDQESRVLCLDKKTGWPLWCTFLASVSGGAPQMVFQLNNRGWVTYQTLLAEQGGVIYAPTNLGVVAALNGVTGEPLWLAKYPRVGVSRMGRMYIESPFSRPANRPLVWKGCLLVLPQDGKNLLVFDRLGGQLLDLPPPQHKGGEIQWETIRRMVGLVEDNLVVVGSSHSYRIMLNEFIRPAGAALRERRDISANQLVAVNVKDAGLGTIAGNFFYLCVTGDPTYGNGLAVYDANTWKALAIIPWRGEDEGGNLLVAGRALVVAGTRLGIYTDTETLKEEFAARLNQSPPHAEALLEFGDVMRENRRLDEAADAYLKFIRAAEGDPRHEARARQVRGELYAIYLRRGEEASQDHARALQYYSKARGFAPDGAAEGEAVRRMAEQSEKLGNWREAVTLYQELIERARNQVHRDAEGITRFWDLARRKIDKIAKKAPDATAEIERRAAEALRKAGEGGSEAFRDVMDRFPNSRSAREAWRRMIEAIRKEGKLEKLRSLFDEFKDRFSEELDPGAWREMLDVLEKLGDSARHRYELARFGELFGEERTGEGGETAKEYAERRLRETAAPAASPPEGPLRRLGMIDPPKAAGPTPPYLPLRPGGVEPPGFPARREIFACGPDVELWDLQECRRLWTFRPRGDAEPAAVPAPEPAARIVGAAFTRDYALVVAWEDQAVSIDPATGRARWRFSGIRDKHKVSAFHATDGRIYLYEGRREGDPARMSRVPVRRLPGAPVLRIVRDSAEGPAAPSKRSGSGAEGEYERLLCLNDSTGEPAWAHAFDSDAAQPGQATFMGPYLAEHAAILHWGPSGWHFLVLSARDGGVIRKEPLAAQVLAHAVDPASRIFYYVVAYGDPSQRILKSLSVDPSKKDFRPIEVLLRNQLSPGHQMCSLAASRDYVCLVAPPVPPVAEYRIWVIQAADGKVFRSISLLEGRTLPAARKAAVAMDEEGLLYVYNVPRGGEGPRSPHRAHLTAFRVGAREGADVTAWDAPAPMAEGSDTPVWLVSMPPRHLALAMPRGQPSEQLAVTPWAMVYDKAAEGYLRGVHDDLLISYDPSAGVPACPVTWWRGRLFVGTTRGLQIWGP